MKFGANAQPFYVLLNNEGSPLEKAYVFDENPQNFVAFLEKGLKNYNWENKQTINNKIMIYLNEFDLLTHSMEEDFFFTSTTKTEHLNSNFLNELFIFMCRWDTKIDIYQSINFFYFCCKIKKIQWRKVS